MEDSGIASSPATGMAEETVAITREVVRDPSDQEWLISIFGVAGQQPDPEAGSKHRIPTVPDKFREYEKGKKYFDPRVVSLGPYHHGKDLLKPMEKHKIRAAKQIVDESRGKILYEKVKELTGGLKEFYDAEVVDKMSDDDFARMMFLDGCFVLHFIDNQTPFGGRKTKLEISNDQIPLIIRDMFLIENQLPFEVLDALRSLLLDSSSIGKEKILEFINSEVLRPMGMFYLVRSSRSSTWCEENNRPLHLLDILRTILLDFSPSKEAEKQSYRPHNFGTVMELKDIGIMFEKRDMKSLMDISYKENLLFPQLLLPTMFINDTTISLLLNLTAFEICSDIHSGCGVASYICFLCSLINHGTDVKELRSMGILHHALGSDDEMALRFNKWPAEVRYDLKMYSDIGTKIRKHRDKKVKIHIVTWWMKYFGTPWSIISFVFAALFIIFTGIRTFFTVFPRK